MTNDERRAHVEATLDCLADAVLSTDLDGRITYLNQAAEALTGWSRQEADGRPVGEVVKTVGLGADCVLIRRDGHQTEIEHSTTSIFDVDGQARGTVMVFRDAGTARELTRHLSHLAEHDALTDLPNRLLLNDRLTRAIALAERHHKPLAVLFLDVDGFKAVNDSLGHAAGDAILRSIAARLGAAIRKSDTVSRYSGDEFVIVLPEIEQGDDAAVVARKLVRAASGPHRIEARNVTVTASVGIALYPDDGRDAETLIKHADAAMYDAKRTGIGSFRLFRPDLLVSADHAAAEGDMVHTRAAAGPRRRTWTRHALPLLEILEDYRPGRIRRH
jgi:diguanylate cyclase (GGDEF)-like protein/PAS domain S-box-containing protein